jgi:hypothetical protein
MDRYAQSGDKVEYLGENGYTSDRENIEKLGVVKGMTLEVEYTVVDKWRTEVKFKGFEGMHNSVMFGDVL